MTIAIPVGTAIINITVELAIVFFSHLKRPYDDTKMLIDGIIGISFIQFINLGLLMLILNINFPIDIFWIAKIEPFKTFLKSAAEQNHYPQYETFTSDWYKDTTGLITKNMVIEMFVPHVAPLILIIFYNMRLLIDRECTCNKNKSKKIR